MDLSLDVWECIVPTVYQGAYLISPVLISCLVLRLLVLLLPLQQLSLETVATLLGGWVLWWYYEESLIYFLLLSAFIYALLWIVPQGQRGVVVGGACVTFVVFWYAINRSRDIT